jgi:FkbM family methyltransferase
MKYPNGTIYSIEPQRLIFQMLCGNLAINNLENVITLNMALGEFDGFIEIPEPDYTKDDNFGSYSLVSDFANLTGRKFKVEMLKLDSLIDRYEIDKIDLIKIDCEGMDYNVLLGAQNSIKKYKPYIIIEYCNDVFDQKDIISKFFEENNYKVFEFQHNFLAHPA